MTNQLFINGVELDLNKAVEFPLTYSIADAKEPEKRKRNASKTIALPGTKNNNTFFQSAYDLNISDVYGDLIGFDFDPSLRYPCRALKNGKEIFRGSAHLAKVRQTSINKVPINEFHVVLYSEIANLFQALGDRLVSELGWSEYDHTLSIANIQASWTAPTGSGYWYPLIDYGFTDDLFTYKTNELFPFVYWKEIVEKCFEVADLKFTSAHFDTALVKKMTFGYGGGEQILLTSAQIADRQAEYTGDGDKAYNIPAHFDSGTQTTWWTFSDVIPISDNPAVAMTVVTDVNAQFDEPTGELVVFNSGSYRLRIQGVFPVTYTFPLVLADPDINVQVTLRIFKNGAFVASQQETIADSGSGSANLAFNLLHEMELDAGDIVTADIHIFMYTTGQGGPTTSTFPISIDLDNTFDYNFTALNTELIDGDNVELSRFLPKMKAADFMKDMITIFNLYMSDPDDEDTVVLEPEGSFYFPTDDVDQWSKKLARGKEHPIEIQAASNIKGKTYSFKWATDRDYYKQLYFTNRGHDYGDYDYEVPSTFKKGVKTYQLKIAQSCPVQLDGSNIIIPRIVKIDEGTFVSSPHKGKPRVFLNNGTVASDSWDLVNSDTGAITANVLYPLAHHLDDLTTPTFDLNFGVPVDVFYIATAYTTDNLWRRHYMDFIKQLTGRDSKLLNAYFKLRESDLYVNFMRRLKNIDGVLWRVNIVKDYLATKTEPTKVELIRIVTGRSRANYLVAPPEILGPDINNTGGGMDNPLVDDEEIANNKGMYIFDSSGGDITVRMSADFLKPGKEFTVKKVSAAGKVTLRPTGGGAPGTSIDGLSEVVLKSKNGAFNVYFDGQVFKLK